MAQNSRFFDTKSSFEQIGFSNGVQKPVNDYIGYFHNQKWGIWNTKTQQKVTQPKYLELYPFKDKFIVAVRDKYSINKKYGLINEKEKILVSIKFSTLKPCGKLLIASSYKNSQHLYGLINEAGNFILGFQFKSIDLLTKDRLVITDFKNKKALYTAQGKQLTKFLFTNIVKTQTSKYFKVSNFGAKGLITDNGKIVIQMTQKQINITPNKLIDIHYFPRFIIKNDQFKNVYSIDADSLKDINQNELIVWRNGTAFSKKQFINNWRTIGQIDQLMKLGELYVVEKNHKYGLYDKLFNQLTSISYDSLYLEYPYYIGKLDKENGGKWQILNQQGKKVFYQEFSKIVDHQFGFWIVKNHSGKMSIIDHVGNRITHQFYDELKFMDKSTLYYSTARESGLMNMKERRLIKGGFKKIIRMSNRFYFFIGQQFNGFVRNNTMVYKTKNHLSRFKGFIRESLPNGRTLLFNKYGNLFFKKEVLSISMLSENKINEYFVVKTQKGLYLVDQNANIVLKPSDNYIDIENTNSDYFIITKNNQKGLIDTQGRLRIAYRYDDLTAVRNDYIGFKLIGRWGFLDRNENIIVQPQFEEVKFFKNGLAPVKKNGKWGLVNLKGQIVLKPIFDDLIPSENAGWLSIKEKYFGYINSNATMLIQAKYKKIEHLSSDWLILENDFIKQLYNIPKKEYNEKTWSDIFRFNHSKKWAFKQQQKSKTITQTSIITEN